MIHENRGLNDNIIRMANTLAKQTGYAVLAVDLFKGQMTNDPNRAMQLVKSARANPQETIANLQSAVKYVSSLPFVDSSKIASIGWCFGGGQSLQLALHSEKQRYLPVLILRSSFSDRQTRTLKDQMASLRNFWRQRSSYSIAKYPTIQISIRC